MNTPTGREVARWLQLRPWQRHSLVLAVAGVVYISFGVTYIAVPLSPSRNAGLVWVLQIAPVQAWGIAFVVVGLLALASTRWPPSSKTWGYSALSGLASLWGAAYLVGVLFMDAPRQSMTGALVWLLVAFLWWAIAGLTNPDDVPRTAEEPATTVANGA